MIRRIPFSSSSIFRLFALITVSIMLISCGAEAVTPAATTESVAAPTSEESTEPTSESSSQTSEVAREDTLIIGYEGGAVADPEQWNPYVQGINVSTGLHQLLTESLFYLNYETGELQPWLAESYETSTDGLEVTIKLRDGVTWSDGQAFTADDVVFTVNMLKDNSPELSYSTDMKQWVSSIEAVDPLTVKITLNNPSQRFVVNFFGVRIWGAVRVVPKHIWEGKDPKTFTNYDAAQGWPVFTGPYKLVQTSSSEFVYDRRDDWWATQTGFHELPAPKRVIFVDQGPEERRAAQLEANQVDAVANFSMGALEVLQAKNPNVIAWTKTRPYGWLDPCPHYLEINTKAQPWDDADMRHALSYALDPTAYSNIVSEGAGVPARFLFPAYPALDKYLDANTALFDKYNVGKYDPTQTQAIFESKGYTKGSDGMYVDASGAKLELDLVMLTAEAGGASWGVAINALTEAFQAVGVTVNARSVDSSVFNEMVQTGNFDAHLQWSCGSVTDPYETMDSFNASYLVPIGERASMNTARYENAEYSAIVDQMAQLPPGDAKIDALFSQALEIWLRDLPGIPLAQQPRQVPANTTYWTNWPTEENNYIQPTNWWMTAHQIIINLKAAN